MISIRQKERMRNGFSQQLVKDSNIMLLFNLIRGEMPISRAALAKRTGLSPTTVSLLVDELIRNNWVCETGVGAVNERGRKPIMLEINAARGCIASVEILSRGYICSLYDIRLNKLASSRVRDAGFTGENVGDTLRDLLKSKRIAQYRLIGIHILFPGIFDSSTGELKFSAVIPAEEILDCNLVATLKKRFDEANVLISNNSAVIAFSEFLSVRDPESAHLLSINIDEGISGGVVTGDAHSDASLCCPLEVGHIIVDRNGPLCKCNNRGCLEALCSTCALLKAMKERAGLDLPYEETFGSEVNLASLTALAERLQSGDPAALSVLEDYVYTLCCGLVSVINLFSVQSVHVGGSIMRLGDFLMPRLKRTLSERFTALCPDVSIELQSGDYESIRLAAVVMSMDEIFKQGI